MKLKKMSKTEIVAAARAHLGSAMYNIGQAQNILDGVDNKGVKALEKIFWKLFNASGKIMKRHER